MIIPHQIFYSKKEISDHELLLFSNSKFIISSIIVFVMIITYLTQDFLFKVNTGNYDPTIFGLIVKFVILVVIIVILAILPLRRGVLITTSNMTFIRFFFSKSFSKTELNKSNFSLTAIYKRDRQTTNIYYLLILQSEKRMFKLLSFTDLNDVKVESYIKIFKNLGVTIDDIIYDISSPDDPVDTNEDTTIFTSEDF